MSSANERNPEIIHTKWSVRIYRNLHGGWYWMASPLGPSEIDGMTSMNKDYKTLLGAQQAWTRYAQKNGFAWSEVVK